MLMMCKSRFDIFPEVLQRKNQRYFQHNYQRWEKAASANIHI